MNIIHSIFTNKSARLLAQISRSLVLLAFAVPFAVTFAHAEKTQPGFFFSQAIGGSYNPLGLILDTKLLWRAALVPKDGLLWESTKVEAGIQNEWTPADNILSARLDIEPIAFFGLICKAGSYGMFNELGYGCYRISSPASPYGPQALKSIVSTDAHGYWISVAPTLKAKFGRLIVLNTTTVDQLAVDGTGYFLEVRSYLPHRTRDLDVTNDAFVLAECNPWLLAGATYHYAYVKGTSLQSQRLCAMAIVQPTSPALKATFAAANVGTYVQDPLFNRTFFLGCLVGAEFRLGPSSREDARK